MTIRNLENLLKPNSVAIIGASERAGSVGQVVLANMRRSGFAGAIYPVNVKYDEVGGLRCYRRIADLPAIPELAVIMTPRQQCPA